MYSEIFSITEEDCDFQPSEYEDRSDVETDGFSEEIMCTPSNGITNSHASSWD